MSDRDELREAFLARAGQDHEPASDALKSLQPRMRRARMLRRATVTSVAFSMAVVVGLAVVSVDTGTPPPDTVQADRGPEVSDVPDEQASPTAGAEQSISPTEPEPSTQPGSLDAEDEATDSPDVTAGPSPSPQPTPEPPATEPPATETPAVEPTEESEPAPTDRPDPTPADAPDPMVEVVETTVGDITVEYTPDAIVTVDTAPDAGFVAEIEKMERTEAKVIFTATDSDDEIVVEVEIHLEGGELTHDISPDDAAP